MLTGAPYETSLESILIAAGLLHDARKADEYVFDPAKGKYVLSDRGQLVGHKLTTLEWIGAAQAKQKVMIPTAHYLGLVHALTATKGAPEWMRLREPKSLEASILSKVDWLSGEGDLFRQMAPKQGGFGGKHRHLTHPPYVVMH